MSIVCCVKAGEILPLARDDPGASAKGGRDRSLGRAYLKRTVLQEANPRLAEALTQEQIEEVTGDAATSYREISS